MSKFAMTDVFVQINTVDLSNWSHNVDTPMAKNQIDVSGFNPNGTSEYVPGKKDPTVTIQSRQDFAAGGPHLTLYPLFESGSAFPFKVRPTSGSKSATNPELSGTAVIYEYNGLSGELDAAGDFTYVLRPANGSNWTWATA